MDEIDNSPADFFRERKLSSQVVGRLALSARLILSSVSSESIFCAPLKQAYCLGVTNERPTVLLFIATQLGLDLEIT